MNKIKLALSVLAMTTAVNVYAHGMMTMTYPEDGSMLMTQAERVEMHFQQPMKVVSLKVIGSNNKPVAIKYDRKATAAEHFKVMLPKLTPDTYSVQWKAMGEDGHMMKGSYGFMQH
ncbi:copper resistance protein C [Marinomonas ushuaiensis DSM 15871]|uniref:Copper resistance protein C n=1 Tax=Marinomonas ushuaiensis DSM 15871 TaxID=1122207 RepID=X7E576_9GAMM|nr:copper resistance CopC family protein [Marinomonas ushuaiensis]ETX11010.1 copper resistance protein C [Marinomonas ushuaiensis DSM 15871]